MSDLTLPQSRLKSVTLSRTLGKKRLFARAPKDPLTLRHLPPNPWQGEEKKGQEYLEQGIPWDIHTHAGYWLRDLQAVGGEQARRCIRLNLLNWFDLYQHFDAKVWEPSLTALRLMNLLLHYGFYGQSAGESFQSAFQQSLHKHVSWLKHTTLGLPKPSEQLFCLGALWICSLCVEGEHEQAAPLADAFATLLDSVLEEDGSHKSHAPSLHLRSLETLITIRGLLHHLARPIPAFLQKSIIKMGQILPLLKFGGMGLVPCQGLADCSPAHLQSVISLSGGHSQGLIRPLIWQGFGLTRLEAGSMLVYVNTALPSPHHPCPQQSLLGLILSVDGQPLMGNCGYHDEDPAWMRALAQTAAHSSICLGELDASKPKARFMPRIDTKTQRDAGQPSLSASVKSWGGMNGLNVTRSLSLSRDGQTLNGQDNVEGSSGLNFVSRFHLNPKIHIKSHSRHQVSLIHTNGQAWIFTSQDGDICLEDSIWHGAKTTHQTQQIVVRHRTSPYSMSLDWTLTAKKL
jgi:uncharacterized heparinase superfamily protein